MNQVQLASEPISEAQNHTHGFSDFHSVPPDLNVSQSGQGFVGLAHCIAPLVPSPQYQVPKYPVGAYKLFWLKYQAVCPQGAPTLGSVVDRDKDRYEQKVEGCLERICLRDARSQERCLRQRNRQCHQEKKPVRAKVWW